MNERFTTLDQVVKDICEIGGDDYDHKSYGKVLKVCVNTLRGFNLYSSTPYVKTEEFEVLPNNTVLLPRNALDVVRVGKNDRCGEIEEIFYSKDLSMDAKNIEEHCQCSGKVQVIETIETGTGDTLCDYRVEGIDLVGESTCDYIIPNARLSGNWVEIEFAEEYIYEDSWGNINGYGFISLNDNSPPLYNLAYTLEKADLDNLATIVGSTYTIKGEDIALALYNKWLETVDIKKSLLVLNNRKLLVIFNSETEDIRLVTNKISPNIIPSLIENFYEFKTLSSIIEDNYIEGAPSFSDIRIFKEDVNILLYVNINGVFIDVSSEIIDEVWERLNTTDIITTYEFRNADTQEIILTGDVDSICKEGNAKTFEVNINGEWEDETNNVSEEGVWELLNTTDIVTEWRYVGFNEGGYAIDYDMSVPVYDFGYMNLYGSDYIKGLTNINTTTADGILITVKVVEDGVESEDSIVLSGDQTFLNIINAINGLIDSSWFITGTVNVGTQNLKIENKAGREGNVIIQIETNNPSAQFTPSQSIINQISDNFGSSWRQKDFGSNVNVIEWVFVQYPSVQIELDSVWTTVDMIDNHWEAPLDIGEVTAARTVLEYIFVDFEYERIEEINTIPFTITPPSEEPGEPTPIVGVCRVDLQRQEVSKWVDNNIECDTNGRCKSCGNFVPTYTTAWYGGWYSSAPIYSRQLAQNNLNLPNSGQAYYEQYTARPYPARWGFYNLDLAKGVLRLSYNFEHGEKIVIIYSTDMVEVEGAKVVAVEWFDMLLYRCKELIWNRNSVDGTRQRQLYEREYTRIKKIYNKTTHEEWRRAIMKVKYSGVKR